jgi:hypothetical protein
MKVAQADDRQINEELEAIKSVAEALEPLGPAARRHVMDYVTQALGIVPTQTSNLTSPPPEEKPDQRPREDMEGRAPSRIDVRTLKDEKKPRSANEMAALVAYYLSELAPTDERTQTITTADIEKYFKQANYPLPGRVGMTLANASSAGYFDSVARGEWRLNPVGYNLVAHGMPSGSGEPSPRPSRSRTTKKPAKKKRTARKAAKKAGSAKRSRSKRP